MNALFIVMQLFIVLFAITIHEASHGWAANKMGDPTAHSLGRVSLNPIAHIDPIGTILLPVLLSLTGGPAFGWAKPVPVNPYNLRNPRRDNIWISFAGPASNLLAAFSAFLILFILKLANPRANLFIKNLVEILKLKSGFLAPIMPQGFHLIEGLVLFLFMALIMNCYFAIFNLIPIPPLDGSGVLIGLLPDDLAQRYDRIRPFGFIIVIFLVYMGFLSFIIEPLKFLIFIFLG
jgi:Zn-dependent protease